MGSYFNKYGQISSDIHIMLLEPFENIPSNVIIFYTKQKYTDLIIHSRGLNNHIHNKLFENLIWDIYFTLMR